MSAPRRVTALTAALLPVSLLLVQPAWASSTVNEIVYTVDTNNDGAYALVLQDLESRRITTLLPASPDFGFTYDDPELSPDASRIALASDYAVNAAPSGAPGIAVINRDGTGYRRLTTPPSIGGTNPSDSIDISPAWSPDGSTLVFTRVTEDSLGAVTTALFTVGVAAGSTAVPVPGADNGFIADYNPTNGAQIVYSALSDPRSGVGPLTVINTDGTGKRPLGPTGALPAWSPDGATIAYATVTDDDTSANDADVAQIATVPAAGGAANVFASTRPTAARTVAEYPNWSADGESILYDFYPYDANGNEQPGDLWAVDKTGTRAGKLLGGTGDEAQVHAHGPAPSPVVAGTASRFTPVAPKRILDTREGIGAAKAKVPANTALVLPVRGVVTDAGPVPANATAVILNVTVTNVSSGTDVRVYPTGAPLPKSSNLNASTGQTVPNLVTATVGADGSVSLLSSGGTVDLLADLAGWYTPDTAGSGYSALDPRRILDTRSPSVGAPAAKVPANAPLDLQVTGSLPTADGVTVAVPSDATAVVLNVTATGASASTDVRVYPTPADASTQPPLVSNLNLRLGQTTPNLVTVAVGAGGKVRFLNANGTVNLIADLAGYYSASSPGRYVPVVPLRFLDTRSGVGAAPTPVTANAYADLKLAGTRGVPSGALAMVLNLTATGVTSSTDVRAFPAPTDSSAPLVSNLNLVKGATRANLAIVKPGNDGRVRLLNRGGSLHLIGDLAGYFL